MTPLIAAGDQFTLTVSSSHMLVSWLPLVIVPMFVISSMRYRHSGERRSLITWLTIILTLVAVVCCVSLFVGCRNIHTLDSNDVGVTVGNTTETNEDGSYTTWTVNGQEITYTVRTDEDSTILNVSRTATVTGVREADLVFSHKAEERYWSPSETEIADRLTGEDSIAVHHDETKLTTMSSDGVRHDFKIVKFFTSQDDNVYYAFYEETAT